MIVTAWCQTTRVLTTKDNPEPKPGAVSEIPQPTPTLSVTAGRPAWKPTSGGTSA